MFFFFFFVLFCLPLLSIKQKQITCMMLVECTVRYLKVFLKIFLRSTKREKTELYLSGACSVEPTAQISLIIIINVFFLLLHINETSAYVIERCVGRHNKIVSKSNLLGQNLAVKVNVCES